MDDVAIFGVSLDEAESFASARPDTGFTRLAEIFHLE
jgi:hypothetical protein